MSCSACLSSERDGKKEPLMPFPVPDYPFQCVGTDIFHMGGQNFLMIVDYMSRWLVVKQLYSAISARNVIRVMNEVFADFGMPETIVSDCGSQFLGMEFRGFCERLGIQHLTSLPLHHSCNGQVERTIDTVKGMMRKCADSGDDWLEGLLAIRNTPWDQGLLSPAQYLQGRVLRDQIPLPTGRYNVSSYDVESFRFSLVARKSRDKYYHDKHAAPEKKLLVPGEPCYYKTMSNNIAQVRLWRDWEEGRM